MKYIWFLLLPCLLPAQNANFGLSTGVLVVGDAAGGASVQLVASIPGSAWTAASNATWLHLAPASTSGTGSALVQFSYDTNPNPGAQSGTLTVGGQTLTVVQAGSSFVPVTALTTLISQGLNLPYAVALDSAGNLYIADTGDNAIQEWVAATQQMTTLVSAGLNAPHGVAVDARGNVYIADSYNNAVEQWSPATQQLTTLVSSGLNFPLAVAVDAQGNVYIADFGNNAIKQWSATTQQMTSLVSEGLSFPNSVTLDGQGNVYLVDGNNNALKQWNAASQSVSALIPSGVSGSFGVATDGQGNFYLANTSTGSILKFSSGYVGLGTTSLTERPQAGTDSVTVQVLGAAALPGAGSDQPWLTITSTAGTAIGFAFQANTSAAARVAHILVLGQQVTVTQNGDVAASLTKSAGDGQSAGTGQACGTPLQVNLTDGAGMPIQGAAVTFVVISGANGAGATFSSTSPMPVPTDQNGNATAPALTANG